MINQHATTLTPRPARYGWRPDLPDMRDRLARPSTASTPARVDLRPQMPPVYDQGQLGSCTANAIGAAFEYDLTKQGKPAIQPSRLFIYYGERVLEGSVNDDAGAAIRDGMKVIAHDGVADEALWPYDIARFTEQPSAAAYTDAATRKCLTYTRLPGTLASIQQALAQGFPVVCGFTVYESFEGSKAATGQVLTPKKGERVLGGHAVVIVGYTKRGSRSADLIWRNSWGIGWGEAGYFHTASAFLRACAVSDFWICETTA